jgi:F0F1-type ATP synthase assembly protein I
MGGAWRAAALAAEFGFSVVGGLVGGVLFGQFLDARFGTTPVLLLVGILGGFLLSLYLMYLIYRVQIQARRN